MFSVMFINCKLRFVVIGLPFLISLDAEYSVPF